MTIDDDDILHSFWLPPTLRLLRNNQLALTIIIWKMWVTYHRLNCVFDWKRGCLGNSEQENVTEIDEFLTTELNERNWKICKTYCSTDVVYSLRSICKTKDLFISWNRIVPRNKPTESFEKGLRGGKHAKNLETFWMNIQTIIEFVWCENYADLGGYLLT